MIEEKTMYRVKCDKCGICHTDPWDDPIPWFDEYEYAEENAMAYGWVKTKSGKFFCPNCQAEGEAWNEAMVQRDKEE